MYLLNIYRFLLIWYVIEKKLSTDLQAERTTEMEHSEGLDDDSQELKRGCQT